MNSVPTSPGSDFADDHAGSEPDGIHDFVGRLTAVGRPFAILFIGRLKETGEGRYEQDGSDDS
jgi:hypothetical protein